MKKILFIIFFSISLQSFSQSYIWWNKINNWDGITNWYKYLIFSPKYMGPNALPVPEIKNGTLNYHTNFQLYYENQSFSGDNTNDLFTKLHFPLFSDRVALDISIVPIEFYKMDTITRDIRHERDFDGKGFSYGDFYVATYIQLIKDKKYFPDVLLTINLKTASGNNIEAARYTDSPGYFFDLSFGKKYKLNSVFFRALQPFAMFGFYCWQTNLDNHFQDDAFLYGLGFSFLLKNIEISNQFGGYIGYLNNGDKPAVYRFILQTKTSSFVNYKLQVQRGLHDFLYTSIRIGCEFDFSKLKSN